MISVRIFKILFTAFITSLALAGSVHGFQENDGFDDSAVVLLYHRFGDGRYPSTNIRLDQIDAHIHRLKTGGYNFLGLPEVIRRLQNRQPLPEKTIVVSVDDAFATVASEGWPRLRAAGIPMTLFVATDPVDAGSHDYLSWDQIRQMRDEGVTIAHHTASHLHMVRAGTAVAMADVERASERFREELGYVPDIFSYPFGEYNLDIRDAIKAAGFKAAFAQFSGPAAHWDDLFALPRFPLNENYGDSGRFNLVSQTKALPVSDVIPIEPLLTDASNPPLYGFTVSEQVTGLRGLACYPSHLGREADKTILGNRRVEIRFDKPFPPGRNRINCTMPAGGGRWYWLGKFFLVPGGRED